MSLRHAGKNHADESRNHRASRAGSTVQTKGGQRKPLVRLKLEEACSGCRPNVGAIFRPSHVKSALANGAGEGPRSHLSPLSAESGKASAVLCDINLP
jgi:hypothetical protein